MATERWVACAARCRPPRARLRLARENAQLPVGFLAALFAFPHVMVTWHGDALEVPRHGLVVALQLRIALILLLVAALSGVRTLARKSANRDVDAGVASLRKKQLLLLTRGVFR